MQFRFRYFTLLNERRARFVISLPKAMNKKCKIANFLLVTATRFDYLSALNTVLASLSRVHQKTAFSRKSKLQLPLLLYLLRLMHVFALVFCRCELRHAVPYAAAEGWCCAYCASPTYPQASRCTCAHRLEPVLTPGVSSVSIPIIKALWSLPASTPAQSSAPRLGKGKRSSCMQADPPREKESRMLGLLYWLSYGARIRGAPWEKGVDNVWSLI
jgi:hypothetical protein